MWADRAVDGTLPGSALHTRARVAQAFAMSAAGRSPDGLAALALLPASGNEVQAAATDALIMRGMLKLYVDDLAGAIADRQAWVADLARPEWNPAYYHRADANGIGFDRTKRGDKAVEQYFPPVCDLFDTKDGTKLFVSIVGEDQWAAFCQAFGKTAWLEDARLQTNALRVAARGWMIPEIAAIFKAWPIAELSAEMERLGLPFAPVNEPGALTDDPQARLSGGQLAAAVAAYNQARGWSTEGYPRET